jgi:hypothetical protein
MKIHRLLLPALQQHAYGTPPDMDPLTENGALQETQLLDLRFDALTLTVGLLFELRTALQLRDGNTGVLVAHGVRELSWSGPRRATSLTAWTVGGSMARCDAGLLRLDLGMWPAPGAQLSLLAERAAFFSGDVPGLDTAPPNYSDVERAGIVEKVAGWDSDFHPIHAVSFDAFRQTTTDDG